MPRPGLSRAHDQVNILLKFPLEQRVGAETVAALEAPDRQVRREALKHIEALEPDHQPHAHDVIRRVVARVSAKAPSMAVASAETGLNFLSIDDLDPSVGPPEGVPIYNPYTGTLSIYPEPTMSAEEAAPSIQEALSSEDEDVEGVEPVAIYRAISALDFNLQTEPELSGLGNTWRGNGYFDRAEDEIWAAAALQADGIGETVPWGISKVGAPGAWHRGYAGQGITVAVVDTGIAPHADLAPPIRGATFIPGSISYNDDHGHGTHVAGTIAAKRGNGIGVAGVAPAARLIAVKVLARDGYSRGDSVAQGITWAANNGARVINMSLGSPQSSAAMRRAVLYARSRNVVVCAAAGNDYGGPVSYPAAFDDTCIAVAAIDQASRRAIFSNRGPQLDVSAPGVGILSTYASGSYRELNGTSMATPHVAGVAAVLLSRDPSLTALAVQRHLEATAISIGAPDQYGRGLVSAERAVSVGVQPSAPAAVRGLAPDEAHTAKASVSSRRGVKRARVGE